MTTGESLVSIWRDFITLEQEKAAAIDAAIAAAVEKRTREIIVECADVAEKVLRNWEGKKDAALTPTEERAIKAIRTLSAPPAKGQ
jgi:hypothetical protein